MKAVFLICFLFLVSCATRTPVTDKLTRKNDLPEKIKIMKVPSIKQDEKQCGPAALAMILQHHNIQRSPQDLSSGLFNKDLGGSFRSDLMASGRREGMMAIELNDLSDVLKEVSGGRPVVVFQNLGFSFMPKWHFSVITGYDLKGPDVYLNSGDSKPQKIDMRLFERSWVLGGHWGALIFPPEQLSLTASESVHSEAASLLEKMGKLKEAKMAYASILKKWPDSYLSLIGLSNVSYSLSEKQNALKYLEEAVKVNPEGSIAWHNLALVQEELGKTKEARVSARKALNVAEKENKESFKVSLKKIL